MIIWWKLFDDSQFNLVAHIFHRANATLQMKRKQTQWTEQWARDYAKDKEI